MAINQPYRRKSDEVEIDTNTLLKGLRGRLADFIPDGEKESWAEDPVYWAEKRHSEFLWSKQKQILKALSQHSQVAVKSAHGVGKTRVAALAAGWWIDQHEPGTAFVITTAPTFPQVRAVLWREIRKLHTRANLAGHVNQVEWMLPIGGKNELVAIGRKPSDTDTTDSMQGVHDENILGIMDEACGLRDEMWEAYDAILSNAGSKRLCIGNPTDVEGEFIKCFDEDSRYHQISISCFDSPNFTGEKVPPNVARSLTSVDWQEDKLYRWGESSPRYRSRVLGEFPDISVSDKFYPIKWISRSYRLPHTGGERVLGIDVGGSRDEDVIVLRDGNYARTIYAEVNPDNKVVGHKAVALARQYGVHRIVVDALGVGRDAFAICRTSFPHLTYGLNVGEKPVGFRKGRDKRRFAARDQWYDQKAELYDTVRDSLCEDELKLDPDDDEMNAQLLNIDTIERDDGLIRIEDKKAYRKKYKGSPDRVEALILTAYKGVQVNYYAKPIEIRKAS